MRLKSASSPWPTASCSRIPDSPAPSTTSIGPGGRLDGVQHADRQARRLAAVLLGALPGPQEVLHAEAPGAARAAALALLALLGDGADAEAHHRLAVARQAPVGA